MAVQFISRASPDVIDSATNNYGRSGNHSLQELAVNIVVVQSDELWKSILTVPLFGRRTSGQNSFLSAREHSLFFRRRWYHLLPE